MRIGSCFLPAVAVGFVAFAVHDARADRATPKEMELVCRNWLSYMVHQKGAWAGATEPKIVGVQEIVADNVVVGRCFSIAPHGHVVVPILKELPAVKAYSDECDLDVSEARGLPELLRDVLAHRVNLYIDRYGSLDASQPAGGDVLLDPKHRQGWDRLAVDAGRFQADLDAGALGRLDEAGPLVTTNWHQRSPYNEFCPMGYKEGDPTRVVVGCVATAASQVLNYHQWPPNGVGDHTYYWVGDNSCDPNHTDESGDLSADFSDAYDWANILDQYIWDDVDERYEDELGNPCTQAQLDAVAELGHEVGVAYEMDYGACGSGAYTHLAQVIFPRHFRYNPAIEVQRRSDYTPEGWFAIIQDEINASRPMLYTIPGHAIVCDGWRDTGEENEYHMNYGWASSHTTWYTVDGLLGGNPTAEHLIRYIQPWQPADPDCNDNGQPDYQDIWAGTSQDCNENGYPDDCDIGGGTSADCQPDGVPDECEFMGMVESPDWGLCSPTATGGEPWCDDFETYATGSIQGLNGWQGWGPGEGDPDAAGIVTTEENHTPGGSKSLKIAAHDTVHLFSGYDLGASRFWALGVWVYIPSDMTGTAYLILNPDYEGGEAGTTWSMTMDMNTGAGKIHSAEGLASLPLLTDQWVEIRLGINFAEDSLAIYYDGELITTHTWSMGGGSLSISAVDLYSPDSSGFYYDDLSLFPTDGNECNNNDVPDDCDIAGTTSEDCQPNGVPDECDLAAGTSEDTNYNDVPDECDTDVAIPTVSEWGMIAMAVLLILVGGFVFSKRLTPEAA